MIGLHNDSDDEINGEQFTLMIKDPEKMEQRPGYIMDTISDLTEAGVRDTLRSMGQSDALANSLLQKARAEYRTRQQQT